MMKQLTILTTLFLAFTFINAQNTIIKNATIHVGNGKVIENGILVTEQDKIVFVGLEKDCKLDLKGKQQIDATQGHLYPGIISLYSNIGLIEIDAVRATVDNYEIGDLNSNINAEIAYNLDSDVIPTVRSNGILITQLTPLGGLIGGNSSAMYLSGWNYEEAEIAKNEGLHINWPDFYPYSYASDAEKSEYQTKRAKDIQKLNLFFKEGKAYLASNQSPKNQRFEGLKGIFEGTKTLYVAANKAKEILEIMAFKNEHGINKLAIVGAQEALLVANELAANNIPVILARIHYTPPRSENGVDYSFTLPFELKKAGVKVAISHFGEMEAPLSRNLVFGAGTTAAYGLTKEEALASITSIPAQILGIDKKLGTLEAGKEASFVLSKGDILDMRTSNVTLVFIKGEKVDTNDKHKQLYEKYKVKYKLN